MLYDEMSRLADEAFRLNARIAENAMLLTAAMSYAWTDSWHHEARRTESEIKAHMKCQARASRPTGRRKPKAAAARGVRTL